MDSNQLQDADDALRFLVDFVQVDLARAPLSRLRQLAWRVQLLINRETPGHWAEKAPPDRAFLSDVQQRARATIEMFVTGQTTVEGDLLLTFVVTRQATMAAHASLCMPHRSIGFAIRLCECLIYGRRRETLEVA